MADERHWRKPSEEAREGTDATQNETMKKRASAKDREKAAMFVSCNAAVLAAAILVD
jgi:hypothetical protein